MDNRCPANRDSCFAYRQNSGDLSGLPIKNIEYQKIERGMEQVSHQPSAFCYQTKEMRDTQEFSQAFVICS